MKSNKNNLLRKHIIWLLAVLFSLLGFPIILAFVVIQMDCAMDCHEAVAWSFSQFVSPNIQLNQFNLSSLYGWMPIIIWLLEIVIIAMLVGIVSSYLYNWLESKKREKDLKTLSESILKLFRPVTDVHTKFKVKPRYKSLVTVQLRLGRDQKDILEAVENNLKNTIRLVNLATTFSTSRQPQDRILLEPFCQNRRYGCCYDNGSNVTIVSTSSCRQVGTGNFAYHVAAMGGFNYISREIDENPDDYHSFYVIDQERWEKRDEDKHLGIFVEDLQRIIQKSASDKHWVIFILSTTRISEADIHFMNKTDDNNVRTVVDIETFDKIYNKIKKQIEEGQYSITGDKAQYKCIKVGLNEDFKPQHNELLPIRLGAGGNFNSFTLRINYEISARDNRNTIIQFVIADALKQIIQGKNCDDKNWKSEMIAL